jgi:hypothetical protein
MELASNDKRADDSVDGVLNILQEAAMTREVPASDVASKFEELQQLLADNNKAKVSMMKGKWELVYSSLIPSGYFPVFELVDFFGYSLESSFGPIPLGLIEGDFEVVSESNPATIKFTSKSLSFGPLKFKQNNSRSYTFLHTGSDFAVALSSSGGKTLLKKQIS